jgi:hypothetical protein
LVYSARQKPLDAILLEKLVDQCGGLLGISGFPRTCEPCTWQRH